MLSVLSVDHHEFAAAARARLALRPDAAGALGRRIRLAGGQCAFLGTCNRAELIVWLPDVSAEGVRALVLRVGEREVEGAGEFVRHARLHAGREGMGHLARVSAGLASQVTGDVQVLGQVRAAYRDATSAGTVGAELHRVFQLALRLGKQVHHETAFGRRAASVGSVAAAWLLERGAGRVALIGAGKTVEHAAHRLRAAGVRLVVLNRTAERAERLAGAVNAQTAPFETRHQELGRADGAVVATGAREAVIEASALDQARGASGGRLWIADLGIPPNVDPAVGLRPGVSLAGLDRFGDQGSDATSRAAAEAIVSVAMTEFDDWLASRRHRLAAVA